MSTVKRQFLQPFHTVGLALLLSLPLMSAAADLYQWKDERGVIHYSDKPPKGVKAERVKKKGPQSLGTINSDEVSESNDDPDAVRCQAERDRLALLQSNRRIQMQERDGSLKELTQEEINAEIEFSRRAIARLCKPAAADTE